MGEGSPQRKKQALLVLLPIAVIGLLYAASRTVPPDAPRAPVPPPERQAAAPATEPEAGPAEEPAETAASEPAAGPAAPGFDVVRVERDGSAAVVGTAEPGSTVTIYADEAPLAEAEADDQGNFVAIFKVEPSLQPRALTLGAVTPEGAASSSEDVVMLLPRAPASPGVEPAPDAAAAPSIAAAPGAGEPVAEVAAEPAAEAAAEPVTEPVATVAEPGPAAAPEPEPAAPEPVVADAAPGETAPGGTAAAGAAPVEEAAPEVVATAIVRGDGVEVTPMAPADASGTRRVTLGSVSYADAGEVTLAGAGTAGAVVRAYVDDRFAEEAQVADDGRWSMQLADMDEGIYRLRIDQLAADGKVASRVETPFQRDFPRAPLPRPGAAAGVPGTVSVTVQPGNNLWTLARMHYGSGVRYTQIFTANREQIRDPDLIYPGQIFNIPAPGAVE